MYDAGRVGIGSLSASDYAIPGDCIVAVRTRYPRLARTRRRRALAKLGRFGLVAGVALIVSVQLTSLNDFFRDRHPKVEYVDRSGTLVRYRLFYYREANDSAYRR